MHVRQSAWRKRTAAKAKRQFARLLSTGLALDWVPLTDGLTSPHFSGALGSSYHAGCIITFAACLFVPRSFYRFIDLHRSPYLLVFRGSIVRVSQIACLSHSGLCWVFESFLFASGEPRQLLARTCGCACSPMLWESLHSPAMVPKTLGVRILCSTRI